MSLTAKNPFSDSTQLKNLLLLFCGLIIFGCKKEPTPSPIFQSEKYLHISHTRGINQGEVHPKLENLDYSEYDMLWLGGDIDLHTSADEPTMKIWDDLYDFGDPNTLWAMGNHDVDSLPLVESYTNRPTFYTYQKNQITFLVLDTQMDSTRISGEQLQLIKTVTDTLSKSRTLVILTHKLLWLYNNPEIEHLINIIPNGGFGTCSYCINPNNFYEDIYPELLNVKQRGIDVFCIAGDLGFNESEFEHKTAEGIYFLASGLDITKNINKILVFETQENDLSLAWEFIDI